MCGGVLKECSAFHGTLRQNSMEHIRSDVPSIAEGFWLPSQHFTCTSKHTEERITPSIAHAKKNLAFPIDHAQLDLPESSEPRSELRAEMLRVVLRTALRPPPSTPCSPSRFRTWSATPGPDTHPALDVSPGHSRRQPHSSPAKETHTHTHTKNVNAIRECQPLKTMVVRVQNHPCHSRNARSRSVKARTRGEREHESGSGPPGWRLWLS